MRLVHFTDAPFELKRDLKYKKHPEFYSYTKPTGFWVSVETEKKDGWFDWSVSNDFRIEYLSTAYEVILNDAANILYLSSTEEILKFSQKYALLKNSPLSNVSGLINWTPARKKYQGIIITPYNWQCRLSEEALWYYGWDCASGCIWDLSCVEQFNLMTTPELMQIGAAT